MARDGEEERALLLLTRRSSGINALLLLLPPPQQRPRAQQDAHNGSLSRQEKNKPWGACIRVRGRGARANSPATDADAPSSVASSGAAAGAHANCSGYWPTITAPWPQDGASHHVMGVISPTEMKLYLDGAEVASGIPGHPTSSLGGRAFSHPTAARRACESVKVRGCGSP